MTNTAPPIRDHRIDAGIRYWRNHQSGHFVAAYADGDDVVVLYGPDLDHALRYRVHAADIDAQLIAEELHRTLVERLRAHGLTADAGPDGGVVIRSSAVEARALLAALDRLEAMTLDREDGVS